MHGTTYYYYYDDDKLLLLSSLLRLQIFPNELTANSRLGNMLLLALVYGCKAPLHSLHLSIRERVLSVRWKLAHAFFHGLAAVGLARWSEQAFVDCKSGQQRWHDLE